MPKTPQFSIGQNVLLIENGSAHEVTVTGYNGSGLYEIEQEYRGYLIQGKNIPESDLHEIPEKY